MTWAAPSAFACTPVVLFAGWWVFRRSAHARRTPALPHIPCMWVGRRGLSDGAPPRPRGLLFTLGVLGVVLALARPQWGTVPETTFDQSREVLLALDLSRSMLAEDVSPTRLARAKLLVEALLDQLHGERVGLVVFAGTAFLQSPLSADYEVLRELLEELDPSYLPQAGTNYAALLATAQKSFSQSGDGDRFLVILSDGEAHDDAWKDAVASLRDRGIRVIGLGIGTPQGAVMPDGKGGFVKDERGAVVLSHLEPRTLQELATATGGIYRDAASWVDIAELVNTTVDRGRKGNYVEQHEVRLRERFQWFLAPAVLLLFLSYWLEFPVFPTARRLEARKRAARRLTPSPAVATALLLILLGPARPPAAAAVPIAPENVAEPSSSPPAATISEPPRPQIEATIAELSAKPALTAVDYGRLAKETITFAAQPRGVSPSTKRAVIGDALAAVDRGEALDRRAADWPALRRELQRLEQEAQQPPPQPDHQPTQEQQNSAGTNAQEQQGRGQTHAGSPQGASSNETQPQGGGTGGATDQAAQSVQAGHQEPSSTNADSEKGENRDAARDGHQGTAAAGKSDRNASRNASSSNGAESGDQRPNTPSGTRAARNGETKGEVGRGNPHALDSKEASLGDLDAAPAPRTQPADVPDMARQPRQTRIVGGGRAVAGMHDETNPRLADALAQMDHIKDGDAPAILFERMNRADGTPPPPQTGKNW
jgi:Ca-activated chloride channel family protein